MSLEEICYKNVLTADPLIEALSLLRNFGLETGKEGGYEACFNPLNDRVVFAKKIFIGNESATSTSKSLNKLELHEKYEKETGQLYPKNPRDFNAIDFIQAIERYKQWESALPKTNRTFLTEITVPSAEIIHNELIYDIKTDEIENNLDDVLYESEPFILSLHNHPIHKIALPSPADLNSLNSDFQLNIQYAKTNISPLTLILANNPIKNTESHHVLVIQQKIHLKEADWDFLSQGFFEWYKDKPRYKLLKAITGTMPNENGVADMLRSYHIQDFFFKPKEKLLVPAKKSAYEDMDALKNAQIRTY